MKNKDILLDVIGDIDEDLIPELSSVKKKKNRTIKRTAIGGICAAAVIAGVLLLPRTALPETHGNIDNILLAAAAYPEMPAYPAYPDELTFPDWEEYEPIYEEWREANLALKNQPEGYTDGFDTFFLNTSRTFLTDVGTENKVYSPLSLFMALSMSAEISDGNTRQQILDVLAQDDIDSLRSHAKSIWQANYMDDGMAKCILASSLWMNGRMPYTQSTIEFLADNYYSSVYSGDPASEEYNKLMQDWLNMQTDGLLEDQVSDIVMDPEMVLTLASTVSYSGKWNYKFSKDLTAPGIFHSPAGDIQCDFLNDEWNTNYFWNDKFAAISMGLENNGQMRLILPDEGITPEDLINDDKAMGYMMNTDEYTNDRYVNHKFVTVNMSVPKFDVSSKTDLKDGLERLGITDAFDPYKSDFSPLTEQSEGVSVSRVEQDTRVIIDEEGCRASSLTAMIHVGAMAPEDYAYFILDRPFIFEIVSENGFPLFIGIVNDPVQ